MTAKPCSCCGAPVNWREMISLGTTSEGGQVLEWANHDCGSTVVRELVPDPEEVKERLGVAEPVWLGPDELPSEGEISSVHRALDYMLGE